MSINREDLKREAKHCRPMRAASQPVKRFANTREAGDEDDEDVRLESWRTKKVDAMRSIASHESRGLKSQEIVEESPMASSLVVKHPQKCLVRSTTVIT